MSLFPPTLEILLIPIAFISRTIPPMLSWIYFHVSFKSNCDLAFHFRFPCHELAISGSGAFRPILSLSPLINHHAEKSRRWISSVIPGLLVIRCHSNYCENHCRARIAPLEMRLTEPIKRLMRPQQPLERGSVSSS